MLSLLAGDPLTPGDPGSRDGMGAAARFNGPLGVAIDGAGNAYVADTGNSIIRKITPDGVVTTLAGSAGVIGSADGMGAAAAFNHPAGAATDSAGNVYVADTGNSITRKITPDGVVTTLAARFDHPNGLALDSAGNIYVTDVAYAGCDLIFSLDCRVVGSSVDKITPDGVVTTLAGSASVIGSADGTGAAASFNDPNDVTTDTAGNLYVADTGNNSIRKITPAGVVTTLAGGRAASFYGPQGVATDSAGNVYVADTGNSFIRMVTPAGSLTIVPGGGLPAYFYHPSGVVTDSAGDLYVADTGNNSIRKITPAGVVTTVAGLGPVAGGIDGTGAAARFNGPMDVATDSAGSVYVADYANNTIRKVTPHGVVTTLAGSASVVGSADGIGAAANFYGPEGVATDSAGNVYVADTLNNTVRKITPDGVVTTLAGSGATGSADGTGAAAAFNHPTGVATDSTGDVYVADQVNGTIRKVTPAGVVTTVAGTALTYGSTDGAGAAARFNGPEGVATDSAGNLYVADSGNNTIRKVTPAGVVTTVAGTAGTYGSTDGTGAAARFWGPIRVATDSADNVYVADWGNNTIRKITAEGLVSTIVGQPGLMGFLPGPLPGLLKSPLSVAIFGRTLYTTTNNAIVQVSNVP